MTEFIGLMAYPFAACLMLAGIHVYLGIHVVERKVIFVDLALAQIAALGSVVGLLLGYELHSDPLAMKAFSFVFAVLGAAIFAVTRERHERVPQEAVIGVIYGFALAASILGSTHLAHGADEIRGLFTGSIMWTDAETLFYAAVVYGSVGILHFVFRRQFLLVSLDPEAAAREGLNVAWWDFWFYVLFAVVVTSSVGIAGVLLVFAYLVIPAVIAVLFADSIRTRLAIGWVVGALVSFAGVVISYRADLPSGPVIVVSFTVALGLAAVVNLVLRSRRRLRDIFRVAVATAVLVAFCMGLLSLRKSDDHNIASLLASAVPGQRAEAVRLVAKRPELWPQASAAVARLIDDTAPQVRSAVLRLIAGRADLSLIDAVNRHLQDPDDVVREAALRAVRALSSPASIEPLRRAAEKEKDGFLRVELAEALVELGDERGFELLRELAKSAALPQVRAEARSHLRHHTAGEEQPTS